MLDHSSYATWVYYENGGPLGKSWSWRYGLNQPWARYLKGDKIPTNSGRDGTGIKIGMAIPTFWQIGIEIGMAILTYTISEVIRDKSRSIPTHPDFELKVGESQDSLNFSQFKA